MTADKTREAIQPRHRNAWTKWLVLRALGMRGWRVRGRFPKPFWRTLVVMHAPTTPGKGLGPSGCTPCNPSG